MGIKTRITSQCDLSHFWFRSSQTLQPTVALIILYSTIPDSTAHCSTYYSVLYDPSPVMFNVMFNPVDEPEIKNWCVYHGANKTYVWRDDDKLSNLYLYHGAKNVHFDEKMIISAYY